MQLWVCSIITLTLLPSAITWSKESSTIWIGCRTHWYTILMINITNLPPVNHSWELVSESQNIIEPMELATQLFVVFLISVYTYLLTLIIWSKTCFPCIPPSGIKVLGEEAYSTYLSLATEESAICQNMNKWALVISQWVIYIQAGQVWYFSEKLCPLLECFS